MNIKVLLFVLGVIAISSCARYTCPTYAKEDINKPKKVESSVEKNV